MKYILVTVLLFISCKNEVKTTEKPPDKGITEKIADKMGTILSERVYRLKKNKEKDDLVFIIEGTKLYAVKNEKKEKLLLEKRGNKVYQIIKDTSIGKAVLIFEKDKYWKINPSKEQEKGELIFERVGDTIFKIVRGKYESEFLVN